METHIHMIENLRIPGQMENYDLVLFLGILSSAEIMILLCSFSRLSLVHSTEKVKYYHFLEFSLFRDESEKLRPRNRPFDILETVHDVLETKCQFLVRRVRFWIVLYILKNSLQSRYKKTTKSRTEKSSE